ncbi:MAG: hypothetical protein ACKOE2_01755 [Actinomycetales bacterium]
MAGLALIGLLIGVLGGFVQADRWVVAVPWGVLAVPWGTALVLLTLVLTVRGACWLACSRWGGGLLFAGWVIATLAMATQTPSGDLAISAGARQWAYVLAGVVLGSASTTFPVLTPHADTIMEPGRDR